MKDLRMYIPKCTSLKPIKTVHSNQWFSLKNRGGYYTIEYHQPQVVVLPVLEQHSIIMVRVKRPVIADNPLELPAGSAQENELPQNAAKREFEEETGITIFDPSRFLECPSMVISPTRYPILPHIYKINVTQKEFDNRQPHDEEIVSVENFSYDDITQMIQAGDIYISLVVSLISRFLFSKQCHDAIK